MLRLVPLLSLALAVAADAQNARSSDATLMQALLSEVRQLRLALERSALVVPRIQIALQRMQLQQGRVDRLSSQLQALRQVITESSNSDANMANELKEMESRIPQEQDLARRRQMEEMVRRIKTQIEFQSSRDQQRRANEAELTTQLQTEQFRLNELSDELGRLEKALGPPPPQP